MNNANVSAFSNMDLTGTKPVAIPMETIEVTIDPDALLGSYAKAFVAEVRRITPLRAEMVGLTQDELKGYCEFLLYQRVLCVRDECPMYRKLKVLYIPSWIQYALSLVGEVILRNKGLKFVPVMDEPTFTFDQAVLVSEKIGSFENDVQIVQDAMPRSREGDVNVMTTALIAGYVRALEPVQHINFTYVSAFLGMKLREEAMFKILYRQSYDDYETIAAALMADKRILS